MPRKSNRRDFLRGKAAARAVADAARAVPDDVAAGNPQSGAAGSLSAAAENDYLLRVSRRAMACEFEICLAAGRYPHGCDTALEALDLVDLLERRLSMFCDQSELSVVNRLAADGAVRVGDELFRLLQMSAELFRLTDGAFDISASPLSDAWGFSRREGRIPTETELAAAMELVGMDKVVLDQSEQTVAFTRPGMRLNLGAIGKGHALDRAAEVFESAEIDDFLINGGNSSALARGSSTAERWADECPAAKTSLESASDRDKHSTSPAERHVDADIANDPHAAANPPVAGGFAGFPSATRFVGNAGADNNGVSPPREGWTVGLADPLAPGSRIAELRLCDRALATSGSAKQFFYHKGRRYSHVLDPRNGRPAEGVLSATVVAATAAEADALATAAFVLGPDRARELFSAREELGMLFVLPARGGRRGEIVSFGLDARHCRIA